MNLVNPMRLALALCTTLPLPVSAQPPLVAYRVTGSEIRQPLTREVGDPARGRDVVTNRDLGNCLLCHSVPNSGSPFAGNLAPPLAGVGTRATAGQLRLRIVNPLVTNPDSIMPAYYRVDGLQQVAAPYRGKPVLTAQQVEDAVAFLATLRE